MFYWILSRREIQILYCLSFAKKHCFYYSKKKKKSYEIIEKLQHPFGGAIILHMRCLNEVLWPQSQTSVVQQYFPQPPPPHPGNWLYGSFFPLGNMAMQQTPNPHENVAIQQDPLPFYIQMTPSENLQYSTHTPLCHSGQYVYGGPFPRYSFHSEINPFLATHFFYILYGELISEFL